MTGKLVRFAKEIEKKSEEEKKQLLEFNNPWSILVVDDDQAIHDITDLILSTFHFENRPLELTFAYSAQEARELLDKPNDFSVLILDVVMETEHAGLDLVSYIRDIINNKSLRIILRTGQPGNAPELNVIIDYDINDYRTKTELTAEKMCSCITSALRSYRDINTIKELASAREKLNTELKCEIEERFAVEKLLASTNDKLSSIINNSTALISMKDLEGRYDLVNETFINNVKINSNSIIGSTDHDLFTDDVADLICINDSKVLTTGEAIQCEELIPNTDGDHSYLSVKFPLYNSEGDLYRICTISTDITERLEAENEILHLAQYDSLTDIPNRSLFIDRLTQAISRSEWHKHHLAVMFIDLDRFKLINDTLGHDIGDQLLVQVSDRLTSLVRKGDSICRLGGDEFSVLLTELASESDIVRMAEKIIKSLSKSYIINNKELIVTASIGISRCPLDGEDVQVLLKKADVAMYKAKQLGRNGYCFYLKSDDSKANDLLSLEVDMRKMLEQKESQLFLLYQPKVNVYTGEFSNVEALVRWEHPKIGVISPAEFIPLLEETGLIIEVGEWVLRESCLFATRMVAKGREIKVAVNLSPRQLQHKEIISTIKNILKETACDPQWIELEVTEDSLMDDIDNTKFILEEISAMGISLAIDDFGTGYSSMNYLKVLPFNTMKIDRSFISDAPSVKQDLAIVTTIAQLANNLGMNVVAEGIETVEQYTMVKSILEKSDSPLIQGFLFSKPVREEALLELAPQSIQNIWSLIEE